MNELSAALLTRAIERLAAAVEEYMELKKREPAGNQTLDARWDRVAGFPPRAEYLFRQMGLETMGDVSGLTAKKLRDCKNVGRVTVDAIKKELARHGLKLRG